MASGALYRTFLGHFRDCPIKIQKHKQKHLKPFGFRCFCGGDNRTRIRIFNLPYPLQHNDFVLSRLLFSTTFSTGSVQHRDSPVQYTCICVRINIRRCLDIRMSHKFFCHIERYASPLEIAAKGMTQAVRRQVACNGVNLLHLLAKAVPGPPLGALILYGSVPRGEYRFIRLTSGSL